MRYILKTTGSILSNFWQFWVNNKLDQEQDVFYLFYQIGNKAVTDHLNDQLFCNQMQLLTKIHQPFKSISCYNPD